MCWNISDRACPCYYSSTQFPTVALKNISKKITYRVSRSTLLHRIDINSFDVHTGVSVEGREGRDQRRKRRDEERNNGRWGDLPEPDKKIRSTTSAWPSSTDGPLGPTYIHVVRGSVRPELEDRPIQGLTCTRCTIDLPWHYSTWKKRRPPPFLRAPLQL